MADFDLPSETLEKINRQLRLGFSRGEIAASAGVPASTVARISGESTDPRIRSWDVIRGIESGRDVQSPQATADDG